MQRIIYLSSGTTSRLFQVVNKEHIIFSRYFATKNNNSGTVNTRPDLYKPSTAKQETHVPDDLKGGQSPDTIETISKKQLTGAGKVWSAQNPDDVHIAPLGRVKATTFVPKSNESVQGDHKTTVYTTQGELNFADPFKTQSLKAETAATTPAELAGAAAASAFEAFPPDTTEKASPKAEPVFSPKISSKNIYSKTTSPTANFETSAPPSSSSTQQEPVKYEIAAKGKVFGGQDTTAETKKRPKENPFNLKEQIQKPSTDIRNDILRESLKYVHDKGWSMEAIRAGIDACNQSTTTESLFYNGYDLVEYFMRDANAKMMDYMQELSTKENIQGARLLIDGLKYRLQLVIPYADTWEQALAQKGLPPNAKRAWKSLLDLADDAWISIGDTSTDIKWYTKRLSIATIYRSAEIYMLQDQSKDKIETMNFLERHLGDFQTTGSVRPSVSQSLSDTAQVASGLLTVVRTMTTRL